MDSRDRYVLVKYLEATNQVAFTKKDFTFVARSMETIQTVFKLETKDIIEAVKEVDPQLGVNLEIALG